MKINWGWKLLIGYSVFVIATIGMIVFTTTINNDKVIENYYEEELKYQDKINMIKRTNDLPEKPDISQDSNFVRILMPDFMKSKSVSGNILFYRPNSKAMDISIPLVTDSSGVQVIPTSNLARGNWKIELAFALNEIKYFQEEIIMLR